MPKPSVAAAKAIAAARGAALRGERIAAAKRDEAQGCANLNDAIAAIAPDAPKFAPNLFICPKCDVRRVCPDCARADLDAKVWVFTMNDALGRGADWDAAVAEADAAAA